MRDIDRIDIVINELHSIWKNFPDMRLGQLLLNVVRDPALYYIEDEDLITRLKRFYNV